MTIGGVEEIHFITFIEYLQKFMKLKEFFFCFLIQETHKKATETIKYRNIETEYHT